MKDWLRKDFVRSFVYQVGGSADSLDGCEWVPSVNPINGNRTMERRIPCMKTFVGNVYRIWDTEQCCYVKALNIGVARCHPDDDCSKQYGVCLAAERAMTDPSLSVIVNEDIDFESFIKYCYALGELLGKSYVNPWRNELEECLLPLVKRNTKAGNDASDASADANADTVNADTDAATDADTGDGDAKADTDAGTAGKNDSASRRR